MGPLVLVVAFLFLSSVAAQVSTPHLYDAAVHPTISNEVVGAPDGGRGMAWRASEEENEERQPLGRVVRTVETFYARPTPSSGSEYTSSSARPSSSSSQVAAATVDENPAHILTTLGRLKSLAPIFTYVLHHPFRALRYYIVPYTFRCLWLAIAYFAFAIWYTLKKAFFLLLTLSSPLRAAFQLFIWPFVRAYDVFLSLSPIWITILMAILIGSGLGAIAGLATGASTRQSIDGLMGAAKTRRDGVESSFSRGRDGFRSGTGASYEHVDKGKGRRMDADEKPYVEEFLVPSGGRRSFDGGSSSSAYDDTTDDTASPSSSRTRTTGTSTSGSMFTKDGKLRRKARREV